MSAGLEAVTHGRDPHLAHHFDTPAQQLEAARLGMWVFIATEVLFFGGLFCAYAVYRVNHPEIFVYAHQFLSKAAGATNTVILIFSSFTMAWAVRAAQLRQKRLLVVMLAVTFACACGFLGVKYTEYREKWRHGLLWASRYHPVVHLAEQAEPGLPVLRPPAAPPAADAVAVPPAPAGPSGLAADRVEGPLHPAEPRNVRVFFSIYFLMTGLHGVHVLGGMAAMVWLLVGAVRNRFVGGYYTPVDAVGLYWHLVDLIWIYLFWLLYLIH